MTASADGTALYRIWGDGDTLLYIGVSDDFGRRWREHAKAQPWWDEMRRLTVDAWFGSRAEAEAAEEDAIHAEKPKYNKQHAPASTGAAPAYDVLADPSAPLHTMLVTVTEVATHLRRSERAVWRLIAAERDQVGTGLESVRIGRTVRIAPEAVAEYKNRHAAEAQQRPAA